MVRLYRIPPEELKDMGLGFESIFSWIARSLGTIAGEFHDSLARDSRNKYGFLVVTICTVSLCCYFIYAKHIRIPQQAIEPASSLELETFVKSSEVKTIDKISIV